MSTSTLLPLIQEYLSYDPATGEFTRIKKVHARWGWGDVGRVVGTRKRANDGAMWYIHVGLKNKQYRAHQLAWIVMTGGDIPDGYEVEHKDGDGCNNRWDNLRLATRAQNSMNHPLQKRNKSGRKGVRFVQRLGKWQAYITFNRKMLHLGVFLTFDEAAAARSEAERRYFGEFARDLQIPKQLQKAPELRVRPSAAAGCEQEKREEERQ